MPKLSLCDYSDAAHILLKGTITVAGQEAADRKDRQVIFKTLLHQRNK